MRSCLMGLFGLLLALVVVVVLFGLLGHWLGHMFHHALVGTIVLGVIGLGLGLWGLSSFRRMMNG